MKKRTQKYDAPFLRYMIKHHPTAMRNDVLSIYNLSGPAFIACLWKVFAAGYHAGKRSKKGNTK